MIKTFPVSCRCGQVKKEYFNFFHAEFAQRVIEQLPTAALVSFLGEEDAAQNFFANQASSDLLLLWRRLIKGEEFFGIERDTLLFSLPVDGDLIVVCVQGADPVFLQRMDVEWLQAVCGQLLRDFNLICSGYIDCTTELPNLAHLQSLLAEWRDGRGGYLALVELPVRSRVFRRRHGYLRFCSRVLREFVRSPACVHYLGQQSFAMIFPASEDADQEFVDFENSLIAFLKKEGCFRVHIGSTLWSGEQGMAVDGQLVLNQAWTALQYAEKRGPFSFCNYGHLAYPQKRKLVPPSKALQNRLGRCWRMFSRFSLLLLKTDMADSPQFPAEIIAQLGAEPHVFHDGYELYLLFPDDDGKRAQKKAQNFISFAREKGLVSFSAGIAFFPYADFKKAEMVMNCKKALIHASFFGSGSVTIFDQTSLNISGDTYFAEGDFAGAISEYRRGITSGGSELNLHNSLGVTLALMNRLNPALDSFSSALDLEPHNFMALYNSGLVLKDMGQSQKAFSMLEQAYTSPQKEEEEPAVIRDIELSLGMLGISCGRMEDAVHYLLCWLEHCGKKQESGRVYRYLGAAYYGIGENARAVDFLQKALHFDQFDAQSLGLLGHLYLQTGEGERVALTLCRKSVELEPDNLVNMLYLAESLIACGDYEEGRQYLLRCQRNAQLKHRAWLLLGELYLLRQKPGIAAKYFQKLSGICTLSADMKKRIQSGVRKTQKK